MKLIKVYGNRHGNLATSPTGGNEYHHVNPEDIYDVTKGPIGTEIWLRHGTRELRVKESVAEVLDMIGCDISVPQPPPTPIQL